MARLKTLTLAVSNPKAQKQFYCDMLGMSDQGKGRVGYNENEVSLMFVDAKKPYTPQRADIYWKITISVPNIELAYYQLST
jgi:catechol 2,3-dioxygenase-like lactoylglutathione lyase family enzyme